MIQQRWRDSRRVRYGLHSVFLVLALSLILSDGTTGDTAADNSTIRLGSGGWSQSSGRIEVLVNNTWKTICGRGTAKFTAVEASNVCRQLGYNAGYPYVAGGGSGDILVGVVCPAGNKTVTAQPFPTGCQFAAANANSSNVCTHKDDVGVNCIGNKSSTSQQSPFKNFLGSLAPRLVSRQTARSLSSAFRVMQLYPHVRSWAVQKWRSGLLRPLLRSELSSDMVDDLIKPVLTKVIETNAGSILVDAFMFESSGAVRTAFSALMGSYRLVLGEWGTKATLRTLFNTISNVTDVQNSRLEMRGLVKDYTAVSHTLIDSSISSISSSSGALHATLKLTAFEQLLLVRFLKSLDETVGAGIKLSWLQEALSAFFHTQDNLHVRQAWGHVVLSAAKAFDQVPAIMDWLEKLYDITAGPLMDVMMRTDSDQGPEMARAQLGPLVSALNAALGNYYRTNGLGQTLAGLLEEHKMPKFATVNDTLLVIKALRSPRAEAFIRGIASKVAGMAKLLVRKMGPHFLLRDGLVFVQEAIRLVKNVTEPPGSPFQAATDAVQSPQQRQLGRQRVEEFTLRVLEVQNRVEQLLYHLYAYPVEPPVASMKLAISTDILNSRANATLYASSAFRDKRLKGIRNGGVCAVLLVGSNVHKACTNVTETSANGTAKFLIPFTYVKLDSGSNTAGPSLLPVTLYWYDEGYTAEIASVTQVLRFATTGNTISIEDTSSVPSSGPSSPGTRPDSIRNTCAACQICLSSLGPIATVLLSESNIPLENKIIAIEQAAESLSSKIQIDLSTVKNAMVSAANDSRRAQAYARAGFLCSYAGACLPNATRVCTNLTVSKADGSGALVGALSACTMEGIMNGTSPYQPSSNSCRTDTECSSSTSQCVLPDSMSFDYKFGGKDLKFENCFPTGVCTEFCSLSSTTEKLSGLNSGVTTCDPLSSDGAACASGYSCVAAPATCRRWTCNATSQTLVPTPCTGICQPVSLSLVSAVLSDNGRAVYVTLNAPAARIAQMSCSRIFDSDSLTMLGGAAASCVAEDTSLTVNFGPGATLLVDSTLSLLPSGSSLVWRFNTSRSFTGSVKVQLCVKCAKPIAQISGVTTVAQPCDDNSTTSRSSLKPLEFDASQASRDPSGRTFTEVVWSVLDNPGGDGSRASLEAAVNRTNALPTIRQRMLLTLTPAEVAGLEILSGYCFQVTVKSWLGETTSTNVTFSKTSAATKPVVKVTGPSIQSFQIRTGIRASAAIAVSCAGKRLKWQWTGQDSTAVKLLNGTSQAFQQLFVPGPLTSVIHGQSLSFQVSGEYNETEAGTDPSTADVTFIAMGSEPVARLTGPSGDCSDAATIVFNATTSFDPDVLGTSTPGALSFEWDCSLRDDSSTPCFLNASRGNISDDVWTIPPGLLTTDKWHVITVTVSKQVASGASPLQSSASIVFRPRSASQTFPRGTLGRVCSLLGCSGLHSTDLPLVLSLQLVGTARNASVDWSCDAIPTLNAIAGQQRARAGVAAGSNRQISIPASVLPTTMSAITITATMDLNGVQGVATLTVGLNSAPYCGASATTPTECLTIKVLNDTAPYANLAAEATQWQDDNDDQLRYEFGVRENGTLASSQMKYRGSASFASILGLKPGEWAVYVCAIDTQGSRTCVSRNLTILAPPANFNAVSELRSFDVASTVVSNDRGALIDMASQAAAMMASLSSSSSSSSNNNNNNNGGLTAQQSAEQQQVVVAVTTSIANALLTSVNGSQDKEQVLQVVSVLASMAGSAAEILPDSSRTVYATAARMATAALLSSVSESVQELVSGIKDICRLLATRLPRGKATLSSSRRALLATTRTTAASAETTTAQSALTDLISLGGQVGVALGQVATPDGGYVTGGDQGVYVSAAVVPDTAGTTDSSTTISLRAGPTAATVADGGAASTPEKDVQARLVAAGATATALASFAVLLQYAPSSSTAVARATTGLLDANQTSLGGLMTFSLSPPPSSSSSAPTLEGDSYVVLLIPAPGYNASRATSCLLYDVAGDTVSEESGSFISYNATAGVVQCRVTKQGSYIVVQGAVFSPPPPPSQPSTRIFPITLVFKLSSADKLQTKAQQDAFQSQLVSALADIYQVSSSAVTLSALTSVRADNTVQVHAQIVVPATRPTDGGAVAGFESNPISKLPASFIQQFGITEVTMQRGTLQTAVAAPVEEDSGGLSAGAIAGIVIGCVVGAALLIGIVAFVVIRTSRQKVSARSGSQLQQQQQGGGATGAAIVRPVSSQSSPPGTVVLTAGGQQQDGAVSSVQP